jgi:hypothetical protein
MMPNKGFDMLRVKRPRAGEEPAGFFDKKKEASELRISTKNPPCLLGSWKIPPIPGQEKIPVSRLTVQHSRIPAQRIP